MSREARLKELEDRIRELTRRRYSGDGWTTAEKAEFHRISHEHAVIKRD